jgi:hypothetical protein
LAAKAEREVSNWQLPAILARPVPFGSGLELPLDDAHGMATNAHG